MFSKFCIVRRSSCLWQLQTPGWGDAIYPRTPPRRDLQASIPEHCTVRTLIWGSITYIGSIFLLLFTLPWHFKCKLYPSRSSIRYVGLFRYVILCFSFKLAHISYPLHSTHRHRAFHCHLLYLDCHYLSENRSQFMALLSSKQCYLHSIPLTHAPRWCWFPVHHSTSTRSLFQLMYLLTHG